MKGIIYKITCNETGEVYYGSTQQSLNARIITHKSKCKGWKEGKYHYVTSFSIIERGNYSYSLIETVECEDRKQLEAVERRYIEENDCINKVIVGRTTKEYNKAYREANKDALKERKKEYYEGNKDKKKEYDRQRRAKAKQLKEKN